MKTELKFLVSIFILISTLYKSTTIPFELIDGKIIINVNIKNERHNFMFDSGAFTIISSELRNKMDEKKSKFIFEGTDANNVTSKMDVFTTNKISIDGLNINNAYFSFSDINWMTSRACKKISGVFGANLMKDKVWKIDFQNKKINIFDKEQKETSANSLIIPFSEEKFTNIPKVNAKVRSQNIEFTFDTGSGMGFSINQKFYNLIKDDNFLIFEGLLSQSINSVSKGEREMDLMEVNLENNYLGKQIVDSSLSTQNLIGTGFMKNYVVVLNFIDNKITLVPSGIPLEHSSFGVAFAPNNNGVFIVNKLQIPELSELNLGDKILKINGIDLSKITAEKYCEVKKLLDSSETITIENNSNKKFTLEKKNVLLYLN